MLVDSLQSLIINFFYLEWVSVSCLDFLRLRYFYVSVQKESRMLVRDASGQARGLCQENAYFFKKMRTIQYRKDYFVVGFKSSCLRQHMIPLIPSRWQHIIIFAM